MTRAIVRLFQTVLWLAVVLVLLLCAAWGYNEAGWGGVVFYLLLGLLLSVLFVGISFVLLEINSTLRRMAREQQRQYGELIQELAATRQALERLDPGTATAQPSATATSPTQETGSGAEDDAAESAPSEPERS